MKLDLIVVALLAGTPSPPPDATATLRGLVNTKPQGFSGAKTFDGGLFSWTVNADVVGPTTAELAIYIDPSGNDANLCTPSAPCQSLTRAFARIPKIVRHIVRVFADAGTYGPENPILEGIRLEDLGGIFIYGQPAQIPMDGGTATGTITSVTNSAPTPSITDSSQTWVTNALKGTIIRITSGTAAGQTGIIYRNSATKLELVGIITPGTVSVGNTYELVQPASVFTANNAQNDRANPGAITVRSIHGRVPTAASAGTFDGGTIGAVTFQWASFVQNGSATITVQAAESSTRVAFNESYINGLLFINGRLEQLGLSRSFVKAKTSNAMLGTFAEVRSILGPALFDCTTTTQPCVSASRSSFGWLNTLSNFIDVNSSGGTGLQGQGSMNRVGGGGTTTGWRINCNSGSGTGMLFDGATTSTFSNWGEINFALIESCAIAVKATGRADVGIQSLTLSDAGVGVVAERGAKIRMLNAPALTQVSTELQVDGTNFTMATLNGNTPQVVPLTPNAYTSWIAR